MTASVAAAVERWGRIDVLVNNAGIGEEVPFLEIGVESWDRVLGTNLRGAFLMAQAVAREQVRTGGGSIVHIASIDGSGGDGPYASYNASKAGLLGLNRTMALELAEHGIRVNCVSPGFTHTEMTESAVPAELMEYLTTRFARVPMRRLVTTAEIAAAVAFLGFGRRVGDHRDRPDRRLRADRELVHPRDARERGRLVSTTRSCSVSRRNVSGWDAVVLESDRLRVTVLPDKGADIFELVDVVSGIDVLFKAPWGLLPPGSPARAEAAGLEFIGNYEGGWQELLPNANDACVYEGIELPFHGEVALLPWEADVIEDGDDALAVRLSVRCRLLPFRLERTMRLATGSADLVLEETVTNEGPERLPFVWGHHLVLGPPFLEAGCRLELPARSIDTADQVWEETARLAPGQHSEWPHAHLRDGSGTVDLRRDPGPERRRATTTSSSAASRPGGRPWSTTGSAFASASPGMRRSFPGSSSGSPTAVRSTPRSPGRTHSASSPGPIAARSRRRVEAGRATWLESGDSLSTTVTASIERLDRA